MSTRFSLRVGSEFPPMIEITTVSRVYAVGNGTRKSNTHVTEYDVVARRWGWTMQHAMIRAQRWAQRHGDPR